MRYFWITQSPKSQIEEVNVGLLHARPAKIRNRNRELLKEIKKGDLIFLYSRGKINFASLAVESAQTKRDEKGEIWTVRINARKFIRPIDILKNDDFLLDRMPEKYSPLNNSGVAHQGYCFELNEVVASYLLSRAGTYCSNKGIIELDKGVKYRVSNLNTLLQDLTRSNVINAINHSNNTDPSDYKYEDSTGYDLEFEGCVYPPKLIFGLAAKAIINRPLFSDEFTGGLDSTCFKLLTSLDFNIVDKVRIEPNEERELLEAITKDIEIIESDPEIKFTERKQLIDARLGQGAYRKKLLKQYKQCQLTGIDHDVLLRASHIKPWSASTNKERLDPFNGLLLSANVDALFDKGLISFYDDGTLILSPAVNEKKLLKLIGIDSASKIDLDPNSYPYLKWHRNKYFPEL